MFHASFSSSNNSFLCIGKDFYDFASKFYEPPSNSFSDFQVWFTTNGVQHIIPLYYDFYLELSFIYNYGKVLKKYWKMSFGWKKRWSQKWLNLKTSILWRIYQPPENSGLVFIQNSTGERIRWSLNKNMYDEIHEKLDDEIYLLCCCLNVMLSHFFREVKMT